MKDIEQDNLFITFQQTIESVIKEKINEKDSLIFDGQLYWKKEDKTPFCPICFETENKFIHLSYNEYFSGNNAGMISLPSDNEHYSCRVCKNKYYFTQI